MIRAQSGFVSHKVNKIPAVSFEERVAQKTQTSCQVWNSHALSEMSLPHLTKFVLLPQCYLNVALSLANVRRSLRQEGFKNCTESVRVPAASCWEAAWMSLNSCVRHLREQVGSSSSHTLQGKYFCKPEILVKPCLCCGAFYTWTEEDDMIKHSTLGCDAVLYAVWCDTIWYHKM